MNKNTIKKAIEILQKGENIAYESLIEDFVWANTTKPKYKVGDVVQFSDPATSILRFKRDKDGRKSEEKKRVKWAIGKITEVRRLMRYRTFQYTIEYETDLEDWEVAGCNVTDHKAVQMEDTLRPTDTYRPTLWKELDGRK